MENEKIALLFKSIGITATIITTQKNLEDDLLDFAQMPEAYFEEFGGKKGYQHHLKQRLIYEDAFFKKNSNNINEHPERFQDFLSDLFVISIVRKILFNKPLITVGLNSKEFYSFTN